MYNRYVPQSDGTYRRNRMPDNLPARPEIHPPKQDPPVIPEPAEASACTPAEAPRYHNPPRSTPQRCSKTLPRKQNRETTSISGFLKQILPNNLDTGDLLVILLLLLMSGDNSEDQNSALLTLALYLFL